MKRLNLETYLSKGVEHIVKSAWKATISNPKESVFMAQYILASKKAQARREEAAAQGEHVPPFLIASITSQCNLRCVGCYARANHACSDIHKEKEGQLSERAWQGIFQEAEELGVSFILLAGGEPLLRIDVIEAAATFKSIVFPIFTNGTMITTDYMELLDKNRNLIPIISLEGSRAITDGRRGVGVYQKIINTMEGLQQKGIIFGASITITKENLKEVTSREFLNLLNQKGCNVIFYVEYVPVNLETQELALDDVEREYLDEVLCKLRSQYENMVFLSFPGDEHLSGGCLAAGRGFFHINAQGGAEPCPFSPYSDTNLVHSTLKEALHSPLFTGLKERGILEEEHRGGCVLFNQKEQVEQILAEQIIIRMATVADAKDLLAIYEPYVLHTPITFEYTIPSAEDFEERIRHTLSKYPYLVAIKGQEIVGYAYASAFKNRAAYDWSVETSIYIKQERHGYGIGKKLYEALEKILEQQHIINVNACITYPNLASIGFHEKLGYKIVGHFTKSGYKFSKWHDVVWMEKKIAVHPEEPEPVIPIKLINCLSL